MSYVNRVISATSEKEFILGFIDALTGVDPRITCTTDLDELTEKLENESAGLPTFDISISGIMNLHFVRQTAYTGSYYVTVTSDNYRSGNICTCNLTFYAASCNVAAECQRSFKFSAVTNEKTVVLYFGHYNSAFPAETALAVMVTASGESNVCAGTTDSSGNLMSRMFYCQDGTRVNAYNRMGYVYNGSDCSALEMIRNKQFLTDGSGIRKMEMDGIYDSTYLYITKVPVLIGDAEFFVLAPYTIMPC